MLKISIIFLILILLTGCYQEYVYVSDGYDMRHFNCNMYEMPYIQDYVNNKHKYIDYNHYLKLNYQTNNTKVNVSNTRRVQRNFINTNTQNNTFYINKIKE